MKSGLDCDKDTSSCPTSEDMCIAYGPGRDMVESTRMIAERMFNKALVSSGLKILSLIPNNRIMLQFAQYVDALKILSKRYTHAVKKYLCLTQNKVPTASCSGKFHCCFYFFI